MTVVNPFYPFNLHTTNSAIIIAAICSFWEDFFLMGQDQVMVSVRVFFVVLIITAVRGCQLEQ